ncbi:type II secretion system protein [Thalassotalea ganghwensis]
MKNLSKQKGFTLIELIVVIVILGILAATAAPRFIDLTGDARAAVVEGVKGSVNSAANMINAKALVTNELDGAVQVNGVFYATVNGYPTRAPQDGTVSRRSGGDDPCGTIATQGCGIEDLIQFDAESAITYDAATGEFQHSEATDADNCHVTYTEAGAGATPVVETVLDDC